MKIAIPLQDLADYIARDLRLHIITGVVIIAAGLLIIYLAVRLHRKEKELGGTESAVDSLMASNRRLQDETSLWRKFFGPFPALYEHSPEKEPGKNNNDRTIAIDLDGVILEYVEPWNGVMHFGELKAGTVEAMKLLKSLGYTLVVYTTRNNAMAAHNSDHNVLELTALVQNQLEKSGVPYDYIALFKPLARYYIDDRAIRFSSWAQTLNEFRRHEVMRHIKIIDGIGGALDIPGAKQAHPVVDPIDGFKDPAHG